MLVLRVGNQQPRIKVYRSCVLGKVGLCATIRPFILFIGEATRKSKPPKLCDSAILYINSVRRKRGSWEVGRCVEWVRSESKAEEAGLRDNHRNS